MSAINLTTYHRPTNVAMAQIAKFVELVPVQNHSNQWGKNLEELLYIHAIEQRKYESALYIRHALKS